MGLEPTTTKRRPLERTLPQSAYRSAVAFASSYASPPFCLPASRCQSSFVLPRAFLIAQARSFDLSLIRGSLCTLRYHPSTLMGDYFERSALDHSATTFRHHGRALGDHWATMGRPLGNLWATIGRLPGTLTSVLLTTTGGFFTRVKKVVTSGSSTTTHARTRARFAIAFRSSLVRFSFSFSVRSRAWGSLHAPALGACVCPPPPPPPIAQRNFPERRRAERMQGVAPRRHTSPQGWVQLLWRGATLRGARSHDHKKATAGEDLTAVRVPLRSRLCFVLCFAPFLPSC